MKLFQVGLMAVLFSGCAAKKITTPTVPTTAARVGEPSVSEILNNRCVRCHNSNKPPKGLDYTNYISLMNTKVVVRGDPAKSKLFQALVGFDMPQMPPMKPLCWTEINSIRRWISSGATFESFSERFVMHSMSGKSETEVCP